MDVSFQLVAVGAGNLCNHAGSRLCVHLATNGRPPAVESGKVRIRIVLCRDCFCGDHACRQPDWCGTRLAALAAGCVLHSNCRRDVPEPGWSEYYYQAIALQNGWLDDGRVVSVNFSWELHRRTNHPALCCRDS